MALLLPKKDDEGRPYISYSQIKNWNDMKSFNLKVPGKLEYILEYFFSEEFPDWGWGQFGTEVEEYICERKHQQNFTNSEREVLDSIEPLGVFQKEGWIDFDEFRLKLYIDDAVEDFSHIRDYKTASDNSRKKYYEPDYWQMDTYGMWVKQETGKLPDTAELVIIERTGNPFRGGGRSALKVGEKIWTHNRELTEERQKELEETVVNTAEEIASVYSTFLKLNK